VAKAIICLWLMFLLKPMLLQASPQKKDPFGAAQIEEDLLKLVNRERTDRGYRPLKAHPVLEAVGLAHSRKMVEQKKLSHNFPSYKPLHIRLMDKKLNFLVSGENIAFSEAIVGKYIHEEFMSSPGHRQNILDPRFTHCGIKLALVKGDYYVTQEFAHIYEPLSGDEVEGHLEKGLNRSL
ncbi:MAG: CAP domain-containing protein, partial [bacterium]|nr:CAP domain-containing protein [bacterium]